MPTHDLHLDVVWLALGKGVRLAIPPLFPELAGMAREGKSLRAVLAQNAAKVLAELPIHEIHRRQLAAAPETAETTLRIEPPVRGDRLFVPAAWQTAVELRLDYVVWSHGNEAVVAYVPALDVEVVVRNREQLAGPLEQEILFALRRAGQVNSLESLCRLQRVAEACVDRIRFRAEIKTPKQVVQAEEQRTKRVLPDTATHLRRVACPPVFEREPLVRTVAEYLAGKTARSVLLVGPSGVGKTAMVHELFRIRRAIGLGETPFWTTSGARLVAGMCGYGMWQERCQAVCREAAKTKAVVHLGNLMELMHVGKAVGSQQGVADFLRPFIERGELLAIAECTPEQQAILERDAPGILRAFAAVEVRPPSDEAARAILRKTARVWSSTRRLHVSDDALGALDRLHRRYATYSVFPGRPLRFLKNLLDAAPRESTVDAQRVTDAFSRETGLPHVLLEDQRRLDLEHTQQWLAERVIGQPAAVEAIADLLAGVKAGLSRPDRPIASLLFIGPTGVGKTEMAKSLAEFLYQDRQRMTRIDMSEYADAMSVQRLIGGHAGSEGVLTARVREQPFGIVLLDEFEKAHPLFYDLLLQVLGEGRLTDARGRLADFRNSVVVMTSNLGSESFGRGQLGFGGPEATLAGAEEHFQRAVEAFVRPEMLNRIDRIVPFLPLSEVTLKAIARRELDLLKRREGILHRDLDLTFTEAMVREVVRLGYDPRYGARPIKRAIDRHLLAPLAAAANEYPADVPLRAAVDVANRQVDVRVKALADRDGMVPAEARKTAASLAQQVMETRREAFQVGRARVVLDLRNRLHRHELAEERRRKKAQRKASRGRPVSAPDPGVLTKIQTLKQQIGRIDREASDLADLEECVLSEYYSGQWASLPAFAEEAKGLRGRLEQLYLELFARSDPASDRATVVVYGMTDVRVVELSRAYFDVATDRKYEVTVYRIAPRADPVDEDAGWFLPAGRDGNGVAAGSTAVEARLMARKIARQAEFLAQPPEGLVGIALEARGPLARPLFQPEDGVHAFTQKGRKSKCLVDVTVRPMAEYDPPPRVETPAGIGEQPTRRAYLADSETIEDKRTGRRLFWKGKNLREPLGRLLQEHLVARAREWVLES